MRMMGRRLQLARWRSGVGYRTLGGRGGKRANIGLTDKYWIKRTNNVFVCLKRTNIALKYIKLDSY